MTSSPRIVGFALLLLLAAIAPVLAAPSATAEGERGMVVSAQHEASEAGRRILEAGGNAVDAAVAVGYALAVVDPCCGNIGGGGFMLIHRADGHDSVVNFRETAPRAARADMYLDAAGNPVRDRSLYGYLAIGVPGTVMGYCCPTPFLFQPTSVVMNASRGSASRTSARIRSGRIG